MRKQTAKKIQVYISIFKANPTSRLGLSQDAYFIYFIYLRVFPNLTCRMEYLYYGDIYLCAFEFQQEQDCWSITGPLFVSENLHCNQFVPTIFIFSFLYRTTNTTQGKTFTTQGRSALVLPQYRLAITGNSFNINSVTLFNMLPEATWTTSVKKFKTKIYSWL